MSRFSGHGSALPNKAGFIVDGRGNNLSIPVGIGLAALFQNKGSVDIVPAIKVGSVVHGEQNISDEATGYVGDGSTLVFAGQVLDNLPIVPGSVTIKTQSPAVINQPTNVTGVVIDSASSDSPTGTDGTLTFNVAVAEVTDVTVPAASAITSGDFWLLDAQDGTGYYVWYNKDAAGNDPSVPGRTGVEVAIVAADTADNVRDKTITDVDALTGISAASGGAGVVTVTQDNAGDVPNIADGNAGVTPSVTTPGEDHTLQWEAPTEGSPGAAVSVMSDGAYTLLSGGGSSINVTVTVASYDAADQTDADIELATSDAAPDLVDNGDGTLTAAGSISVGTIDYFTGRMSLTYASGEAPAPGALNADYVQGKTIRAGGSLLYSPSTLEPSAGDNATFQAAAKGKASDVSVEVTTAD